VAHGRCMGSSPGPRGTHLVKGVLLDHPNAAQLVVGVHEHDGDGPERRDGQDAHDGIDPNRRAGNIHLLTMVMTHGVGDIQL
jgi:hypothetical protein